MILRPAEPRDADQIRRIEEQSGSQFWDYMRYECTVADLDGAVAGYLLIRTIAADQFEILNIAVALPFRRTGIAEAMIRAQLNTNKGEWFLEVRESNLPARSLYQKIGFRAAGTRPTYYSDPTESCVVMSFRSC